MNGLLQAMFDMERDKLKELAARVLDRADELERYGSTLDREKEQCLESMAEAKRMRSSLEEKSLQLEARAKELATEQAKAELERSRLKDQIEAYNQLKSNLICNLCGNGLSRGNWLID